MNTIHQGLPAENFTAPSGISTVTIDTKSGLLASSDTPAEYVTNELFNSKYVPKAYSDVWQPVAVCPVSGQKLSAGCPGPAETRMALVRKEPWVPIENMVPADAVLELTTECEIHGGEAAAGITLSGNGRYTADGTLQSVELQWTAAQGERVVYMIHRATSADFSNGDLVDAASGTSYIDGAPVSGATNYYRIVAIDEVSSQQLGVSGIMSFAAQTDVTPQQPEQQPASTPTETPANTQPQTPSGSISLNGSSSSGVVSLTWNTPGSGSYQYFVFRDGAQIGKDSIITEPYYTDNTAEPGVAYSYSVICTEQNAEVARSNSLTVQN